MKPENSGSSADPRPMEFGPQPLDALITKLGVSHSDLVTISTEQLTHKQIAKARRGRRLTVRAQDKIARAVAAWIRSREGKDAVTPQRKELFNYRP